MSTQEKTKSRDFNAEINLSPDATIGDKVKALRLSKKMTLTALSRASGISDRAIRYIENNERQPGVDAIRKLSTALDVSTGFFMDDALFQEQSETEEFLAKAKEVYGSRGKAQAASILDQTQTLYAGGELSDADKEVFRNEMMAIFWDSKERAKKFTPKKYRT